MSGTETILLIVLGFSLASLIALFMGRMIWTTALKLGARRMQRQVPSSLVGLQTERDRLRAEYAMLAQRLGARLDETKLRLAENMAEVSRHRNRIQQTESSEAARNAEMRQLRERVKELELALADSTSQEGELRQALAAREEALRKLRRKRGYEGRERSQPAAAAPVATVQDAELRLRQRIDQLSEMAKSKPPDNDPLGPLSDSIAGKLAEAERQTRELETELQKLETEWTAPVRQEPPTQPEQESPDPTTPDNPDNNVILLPNRTRDLKTGTSSIS